MGELTELAAPVFTAIVKGNYLYGTALGLVLLVAVIRRFGGAKYPVLASKKAAPYLVLASSFFAAIALALSSGGALSLAMVYGAFKVAIAAAGGYSLFKGLLSTVEGKAPAWMSPIFLILNFAIKSKDNARLTRAKKAGLKAVKEDPSEGPNVKFKDF